MLVLTVDGMHVLCVICHSQTDLYSPCHSQTSKLTHLLLTYRQAIFVTVYSHLLCASSLSFIYVLSHSLLSARSFVASLVAMDEHFLHSGHLVDRAAR